ncbi:hypothetical protein DPMN_027296 [Dreissena polymorpha]|uniref:Uncharacterized protein n=1 Tax=Dreissena polymorpha TaxID=45954 RepID=A0A9D4LU33_DREPO|nr:hypothetical protein DPMN_027296 [Dreissena polymorpha]
MGIFEKIINQPILVVGGGRWFQQHKYKHYCVTIQTILFERQDGSRSNAHRAKTWQKVNVACSCKKGNNSSVSRPLLPISIDTQDGDRPSFHFTCEVHLNPIPTVKQPVK